MLLPEILAELRMWKVTVIVVEFTTTVLPL